MKTPALITLLICSSLSAIQVAHGQAAPASPPPTGPAQQAPPPRKLTAAEVKRLQQEELAMKRAIDDANKEGVETQIQSIAHYRGARKFQLSGVGLVVGLESTGDSSKSTITQTLYSNYFKSMGLSVAAGVVAAKNVALVQVTADLPAFTKPGTNLDVTVSSIGDAKSLQGGMLVMTPLYGPTDHETIIASASGALSIGGFNAGSNGSSVQKNHVNIGRVPNGCQLQTRIESQVVFKDGDKSKLYLDLDETNATTVSRIAHTLSEKYPEFEAAAVDTTTVSITIPSGMDPSDVMSKVNQTTVYADTPAKVVINERTGAIVIGGNVTIGPALVVSGSLNVRIDTQNDVVQPGAFSNGVTTGVSNSQVSATEDKVKIALLMPTTKVWDLAKIFQVLELKPNDVITILQLLAQQGALKARIETQ